MTYRKKLIEVSLPLAAINAESAREKSIRHGHPSTLHLWWARRPLAACRAVLFASLVDDPDSDPQYRKLDGSVDEDSAGIKRADLFNLIEELVVWENSNNPNVIRSARAEIARCVASRKVELKELDPDLELSPGDGESSKAKVTVRDLVTKGHCRPQSMGLDKKAGRVRFMFDVSRLPPADVVNAFLAEHAPPVLDPFAGGGSIPLEAQRLGLRAYASDLNPVPVLINKALIEIPPKFAGRPPVNPESRGEGSAKGRGKKGKALIEQDWPGATGLAEDVRYYGQWMRDEAEKRIGNLYPKVEVTKEMAKDRPDLLPYVGQKLTVIAWLWARTVASPNPAANGAHVPLVRSYWLATKKGKEAYVQPVVDEAVGSYHFEVKTGIPATGTDLRKGTVDRNGATCLLTRTPIAFDYIRTEGKGGRIGTRLMAIVCEGARGRVYLQATDVHEDLAKTAAASNYPDTDIPVQALGFRVQLYGMDKHFKLFTSRQLVVLTTLSDICGEVRERIARDAVAAGFHGDQAGIADGGDGGLAYAESVVTYLAFTLSRIANYSTTLCSWHSGIKYETVTSTFARQALAMGWDFAESNPFSSSSGNLRDGLDWVARCLEVATVRDVTAIGEVLQRDARNALPVGLSPVISTDPPYYDNIGYADLSDFFYVWIRRTLAAIYPSLLSTLLTPKTQELIATPHRHDESREKAHMFFEDGLRLSFAHMCTAQLSGFPLTVFYAFKQSETDEESNETHGNELSTASTGWETMLAGLVQSGLSINGTWPMRTELIGNLKKNVSALASSIVLVCRPRPDNASLATRKEFITALRRELPEALRNLQRGNIAPVDLAQAAIGPGMAVFTRYSKVLESDGSAMSVRTALGLINQTLDEVLAEQEGEFDGDTRWALAWFEQFGMDEGPFGDAETLSKAKNTAINGLVEAGIIVAKSGKVRLIRRDELPADWNPTTDKRLTVWEVTQHLIHRLDEQGETGAAGLVNQLGGIGEVARDLAYRLYSTCERKKWAQDALAYNSLVVAWPELTKLALAERNRQPAAATQSELFK